MKQQIIGDDQGLTTTLFDEAEMDNEPGDLNIETEEKTKVCHRIFLICSWQRSKDVRIPTWT